MARKKDGKWLLLLLLGVLGFASGKEEPPKPPPPDEPPITGGIYWQRIRTLDDGSKQCSTGWTPSGPLRGDFEALAYGPFNQDIFESFEQKCREFNEDPENRPPTPEEPEEPPLPPPEEPEEPPPPVPQEEGFYWSRFTTLSDGSSQCSAGWSNPGSLIREGTILLEFGDFDRATLDAYKEECRLYNEAEAAALREDEALTFLADYI